MSGKTTDIKQQNYEPSGIPQGTSNFNHQPGMMIGTSDHMIQYQNNLRKENTNQNIDYTSGMKSKITTNQNSQNRY